MKKKFIRLIKKISPFEIKQAINALNNLRNLYISFFFWKKKCRLYKINNGLNAVQKTLLFDLLFCQGGFHGGGEYGKAVFMELVKIISSNNNTVVFIAINPSIYIEKSIIDLYKSNKKYVKIIRVNNYEDIVKLVNRDIFDIFFTPAIVVYAKGYKYMQTYGECIEFSCQNTKVYGTLHDIRDYELSKDNEKIFQFKKNIGCRYESNISSNNRDNEKEEIIKYNEGLGIMYKTILNNPSITKLITVSHYSKESIVQEIFDPGEKIKVFYACMKQRFTPEKFMFDGIDFNGIKYLLAVNVGRYEKNGSAIVRAMDLLFSSDERLNDYFMVVTGVNSINDFDLYNLENIHKFIILGFLMPKHLEYLYKHATCLLYISFNEGFGYPPIEAMSYGVPSVVSNLSSMPEICGEAAVYCDPFNIESVKMAITDCLTNPPSSQIVEDRYKYITAKQNEDLKSLISLLLND